MAPPARQPCCIQRRSIAFSSIRSGDDPMRTARHSTSLRLRAFGAVALFALALPAAGHAQEAPRHRHHVKAIHVCGCSPAGRCVDYIGQHLWLARISPWRRASCALGTIRASIPSGAGGSAGIIFTATSAATPSPAATPSLGMIDEYGGARGGYGGPHFDSVGGFHDGAGPGAQEAAGLCVRQHLEAGL